LPVRCEFSASCNKGADATPLTKQYTSFELNYFFKKEIKILSLKMKLFQLLTKFAIVSVDIVAKWNRLEGSSTRKGLRFSSFFLAISFQVSTGRSIAVRSMMIQFGAAITAQIGRTCRFSWPAHQLEPSAKKLAVIDQKASLMLAKVSRIHQTPSNPLFALVADPLRWIEVAATHFISAAGLLSVSP
jgi:hypothetical protein